MARIAAIFSLACGAVIDLGICRYAGKGQSELRLAAHADERLSPWGRDARRSADVCVDRDGDAQAARRRLRVPLHDLTGRPTFARDSARAQATTSWSGPSHLKPRTIDRKTYAALPDSLTVRECRVRIEQPGFRIKTLVIATTLLDAEAYTKGDLAELYRARWNAELDLRSLKQTLQMDILRCRTPELVRKEIWTHILAYNLIRTIIAQAATKHGVRTSHDQLQGRDPDTGSLPADDRHARLSHDATFRAASLRTTARCHRRPPRR